MNKVKSRTKDIEQFFGGVWSYSNFSWTSEDGKRLYVATTGQKRRSRRWYLVENGREREVTNSVPRDWL